MENDTENDTEVRRNIKKLITKRNKLWYEWLYREGYICYFKTHKTLKNKYLKERKENIQKRYKEKKYKEEDEEIEDYYPYSKRLIIKIERSEKPLRVLICLIQMLSYLCKLENIYQYNCIDNVGYKYYNKENIIIYIIDDKMTPKQIEKISKAARKDEVNGQNIKNKYKIIITMQKFEGCKDWEKIEIMDNKLMDSRETIITRWKGYYNINLFLKETKYIEYCDLKGIEPWPFEWK